ncbi:hypothetical protein M5689_005789 [Euphorbia peplus]|nr:hypothetical protein M5689_005789 [Euphorbia peplus]
MAFYDATKLNQYVTENGEGTKVCNLCEIPIKGRSFFALQYHFAGRETKHSSPGCDKAPLGLKEVCEISIKSLLAGDGDEDVAPEVEDLLLGFGF